MGHHDVFGLRIMMPADTVPELTPGDHAAGPGAEPEPPPALSSSHGATGPVRGTAAVTLPRCRGHHAAAPPAGHHDDGRMMVPVVPQPGPVTMAARAAGAGGRGLACQCTESESHTPGWRLSLGG